jgi:hypothetical protein
MKMQPKKNNLQFVLFASLLVVIAIASIGFYVSRPQTAVAAEAELQAPYLGKPADMPIPAFPVCVDVSNALICIVEIVVTPNDTKVVLGLMSDSNIIQPGMLVFALPDAEKKEELTLLDESGGSLMLMEDASDFLVVFSPEQQVYKQTLVFNAVKPGVKNLTLKIPLVSIKVLSAGSFQVNLGSNPQPGQVIPLDSSFSIGDQIFNLDKAEFDGDGSNSLRVTLYSVPMDLPNNIASIQPVLGLPEGVSLGFGTKTITDGWPFRAFADLIAQPGQPPVSGIITIPIEGIIYNYRGPFNITFQLPP